MESNWRFNVWLTGSTTLNIDLVAQRREPAGRHVYIGRTPNVGRSVHVEGSPDMGGFVANWFVFGNSPDDSFPYGNDVFPD